MKAIRDAGSTPDETVVCFGKFKGWMYREVPQQYLDWTIAETDANPNSSDDLRRLANWAKQAADKSKSGKASMRTKSLATDPEALAKIPPPTIRTIYDGPASDASWSQVSDAESRGKGKRQQNYEVPTQRGLQDERARGDQSVEISFGDVGASAEVTAGAHGGGLNYVIDDDEALKSFDKSCMRTCLRMRRSHAVSVDEKPNKSFAVKDGARKGVEYVLMTSHSSDEEDYVFDEPFVPEERYYSKRLNPKALGKEEIKRRALAGIRRRKLENEPKLKKVKRSAMRLATVFATMTVALAGWSKEMMTQPFEETFDVVQPFVAWATGSSSESESEVDCLELFAGKARISEGFAKRGRGVLQPRDLVFGHDLRKKHVQEEVIQDMKYYKPGMVWMAPPCTVWCGFSRLNYSPQELRRRRLKEKEILRFVKKVASLQGELGGIVVIENPRTSDIWRTGQFQELIVNHEMSFADVDLCSYGMRSKSGEEILKKPISLLTNSEHFAELVEKKCPANHSHRVIQGGETAHSAAYPALAPAVFHAYDRAKHNQVKEVFAAEAGAFSSQPSQPQGKEEEDPAEEVTYGAQAISFKGKVNPEVAAVLKKVHQNLGHPPNKELVKHLKIAGAGDAILRAAEQLVCRTCSRSTKASHAQG